MLLYVDPSVPHWNAFVRKTLLAFFAFPPVYAELAWICRLHTLLLFTVMLVFAVPQPPATPALAVIDAVPGTVISMAVAAVLGPRWSAPAVPPLTTPPSPAPPTPRPQVSWRKFACPFLRASPPLM